MSGERGEKIFGCEGADKTRKYNISKLIFEIWSQRDPRRMALG